MRAVLSLVLVVSITAVATAQPTGDKPDFNRAAELYKQAEAEMASSQYADAARDYAIAFDITKDPVLFFKIASANDKAGRCDLALTYYRRYLNEGKPNDAYKKLTTERITVCEKATGTSVPDTTGDSGASSTTTTDDAATGAPATDDATAQPGGERPSITAEKPNR